VTTGAESDLQQVNQIARSMVARFGMSPKLGPLNLTEPGDGAAATQRFSEETAKLLDEEVRRIVDECHRESVRLLTENRDRLDHLAEAVLKKDTLDQDEIYAATGISKPPSPRPVIAPPLPANGSSHDGDLAKDEVGSEIHRA
jgi:cell division protease FtsH